MNKLYFFFLASLLSSAITAQDHLANTVILYNVVPLRVDLNIDGTIKKIYGEDNTFLRGYKVVRREEKTVIDADQYSNSLNNFLSIAGENYEITFDKDRAVLNESTIKSLDDASAYVFFNGHKLVVNSYKAEESPKGRKLYKNRLNALLTYLDIKGMKKENIIINLDELTNQTEGFKLSFVK
jgi:hypothetical protein